MGKINELLQAHSHRGWPLPRQRWRYYQEWNQALFMHWAVPAQTVARWLPEGLRLHQTEGSAWVSVVPFRMERIRPRNLPAVAWVSDFAELNVRTYVVRDGKPGVYFLSLEAAKPFAARLARSLSGLPYRHATIHHQPGEMRAHHPTRQSHLHVRYQTGPALEAEPLDLWLTERYAVHQQVRGQLRTFEVLHHPWALHQATLETFEWDYPEFEELLQGPPHRVAYSPGVHVVAWDPY